MPPTKVAAVHPVSKPQLPVIRMPVVLLLHLHARQVAPRRARGRIGEEFIAKPRLGRRIDHAGADVAVRRTQPVDASASASAMMISSHSAATAQPAGVRRHEHPEGAGAPELVGEVGREPALLLEFTRAPWPRRQDREARPEVVRMAGGHHRRPWCFGPSSDRGAAVRHPIVAMVRGLDIPTWRRPCNDIGEIR